MELETTFGRTTKVWWAYFWRSILAGIGSLLVGSIIGGVLFFLLSLTGMSQALIQYSVIFTQVAILIVAQILVMGIILEKSFGNFRLVPIDNSANEYPYQDC